LVRIGLGQVYNGEFKKGLVLNGVLCVGLFLYGFRVYCIGTYDLLLFVMILSLYVIIKAYSIAQAFMRSRSAGVQYSLKSFNRIYFYILFVIVSLVVCVFLSRVVQQYAVLDMTSYHPFRSQTAKEHYLRHYDMIAKRWPVASEERMVPTSYGQTFVRISGPADSPALVLLHGVGGNSLQWAPNVEALSKEFRIYAVDTINDNGRSIYVRAIKTSTDFVEWLDELFTALKLNDRINLVGLSYGGWITSQYALHHPERLHKIIMIAPAGTIVSFSPEWIKRALLCTIPDRYFLESFSYWLMEDCAKDNACCKIIGQEIDFAFMGLRSFKPKNMVNPNVLTDEEIGSIKVPALFMIGEHEKIYNAQQAVARVRNAAPQIEVEIIPDAGHDLTFVRANQVNEKVVEFLRK